MYTQIVIVNVLICSNYMLVNMEMCIFFSSRLLTVLVCWPFSNDETIFYPLKSIYHPRKPYFWHQNYKNQLIR